MLFEFDPDKDAANITKHGLSLADAWLVYEAKRPTRSLWNQDA